MDNPFHRLRDTGAMLALPLCTAALTPVSLLAQAPPSFEMPHGAAVIGDDLVQAGELVAVDLDRGVLVVVGEAGTEMRFLHDALTEVDTLYEGVAGLAGQRALWLRIHYRIEGMHAIAERIEIADGMLRGETLAARGDGSLVPQLEP